MKKLSFCVAAAVVLSAAGSSQAITLYEKDNFSYSLSGDWQIQLRQDYGVNEDLDLEYDDLELKNRINYDLGNDLSAFGQLDFGGKKAADEAKEFMHLEEAYLGFKFKNVSFLMGKTNNPVDRFGVHRALEDVGSKHAFQEAGKTDGDDLLIGSVDMGPITVMASHEIKAESEKSYKNGSYSDLYVEAKVRGVKVVGAYQHYDNPDALEAIDIYGVLAMYKAGAVEVGVDYSVAEDVESVINVSATIRLKPMDFAVGYITTDYDAESRQDIAGWYVNAMYNFPQAKGLALFAEISDTDGTNVDMGYLAGIRWRF